MLDVLLDLMRTVWLFGKDRRGVVLENVTLRQHLRLQAQAPAPTLCGSGPLVLDRIKACLLATSLVYVADSGFFCIIRAFPTRLRGAPQNGTG